MVGLAIVEILLVTYIGFVGLVAWHNGDRGDTVVPVRIRTDGKRR